MNFTSNARWNILLPNIDIRDRKVKKYENIKFLTNIKTVSRKRENHASYTLLALNTAVSFRLFDKIFLNGHWLNTSECWAAVSEICILICDWPQLTTDKWRESKQSPSWKYCLHNSFYTVANLARGHIILFLYLFHPWSWVKDTWILLLRVCMTGNVRFFQ